MPTNYVKRKRYKRRRYKRRRRVYRKRRSMYAKTPATPLGKTFKFKTRYFDKGLSINPGAGGLCDSHVFCANGLYNPDITTITGDHQPIFFDEIMNVYDHYTVIASRIRVLAHNTSNTSKLIWGVYVNDNLTEQADSRVIIENGLGKWGYLLEEGGNAKSAQQLTLGFSAKKFFGKKPLQDPNLQGNVSANPSEGAYFHVWAADLSTSDPGSVDLTVEIEYVAIMTEPQLVALS